MNPALPHIETIPRKVAIAVLATILMSIVVVTALMGASVYRDVHRQAELDVLAETERHAQAISEVLEDSLRVASQYPAIDRAFRQEALEGDWWQGETVVDFHPPQVPDVATIDLTRIRGMIHYDGGGRPMSDAEVDAFATGPIRFPDLNRAATVEDVFYVNGKCNLSVVVPQTEEGYGWGGADLVFCDASDIERNLLNTAEIGKTARLWLSNATRGSLRFLAPVGAGTGTGRPVSPGKALARAVELSRRSPGRPWSFVSFPEGKLAVAYVGIPNSDWGLVLTMDSRDLYAGVNGKLIAIAGSVLILALVVSLLAYMSVRPLIGRLNGLAGTLLVERRKRRSSGLSSGELNHQRMLAETRRMRSELVRAGAGRTVVRAAESALRNATEPLQRSKKGLEMTLALLEAGLEDTWEVRETVSRAVADNEKAEEAIRHLLELMGENTETETPGNPQGIVNAVLAMARPKSAQAGIALTAQIEPGLPDIAAGENLFKLLLLGLIDNAIEVLASDPPREPWITVAASRNNELQCVTFKVSDNRPDASRQEIESLFQTDFDAPDHVARLRLIAAQNAISAQGGRIYDDREPGSGTSIVIDIPQNA